MAYQIEQAWNSDKDQCESTHTDAGPPRTQGAIKLERAEIYTYPPEWIPTNPTLDSFQYVLFSSPVPQSLLNSIFMGITSTTIALILAASAAYGFSRYRFRAKTGLMLFILGIQMAPWLQPFP